jgi:hypothetical protein
MAKGSPIIQLEHDYQIFKNALLDKSVNRPPFCEKVFSLQHLQQINDYMINTYEDSFAICVVIQKLFSPLCALQARIHEKDQAKVGLDFGRFLQGRCYALN